MNGRWMQEPCMWRWKAEEGTMVLMMCCVPSAKWICWGWAEEVVGIWCLWTNDCEIKSALAPESIRHWAVLLEEVEQEIINKGWCNEDEERAVRARAGAGRRKIDGVEVLMGKRGVEGEVALQLVRRCNAIADFSNPLKKWRKLRVKRRKRRKE